MKAQDLKFSVETVIVPERKTIVVCGATGTQGSSVVEQLLVNQDKWKITALSRNVEGPGAKKLAFEGVEVKQADLEDKESLIQAFKGAYGVFAVTQPWSADNKHCYPEKEIQQGKNIVDACLANQVKHVVYSSVLNFTSKRINVPHVDSKLEIEHYLKSTNLNFSIIRLPQFMDNLGSSFFPVKRGTIKGFVDADARVPYLCSKDIGKLVIQAFNEPERFRRKELSVIGDMVSGLELSQLMSSVRMNERFRYKSVPKLLLKLFAKEFYTMRVFFETYGRPPFIEIPEKIFEDSKKLNPDLISMKEFLVMKKFDIKVLS